MKKMIFKDESAVLYERTGIVIMRSIYLILLLSMPLVSYAQVLQVDGLVASGATGHYVRPKGQFIFESDQFDSTSHAIITGHVMHPDDEGALEFVVMYDDGESRQASADFTRTIDAGFGTGDWPTARVVRAIHVNSGAKGDTTPFAVYDGNSVRFLLGDTSLLPWNTLPIADNMASFGADQQVQIMPHHRNGSSIFQSYNPVLGKFTPFMINASITNFSVGNIQIENPKSPAGSGSPCSRGEISWSADYIYVCVAPNAWRRSTLLSF